MGDMLPEDKRPKPEFILSIGLGDPNTGREPGYLDDDEDDDEVT
jgi:hypothetical protein